MTYFPNESLYHHSGSAINRGQRSRQIVINSFSPERFQKLLIPYAYVLAKMWQNHAIYKLFCLGTKENVYAWITYEQIKYTLSDQTAPQEMADQSILFCLKDDSSRH